ncbi:MAG: hypothetical protein ACLP8Y_09280 [Thermoplasmata archaeon]
MPAIHTLHDHWSAGAHAGPAHRRTAASPRRAWRRRSRRAQVSAVATILGLLLVVTFIANYIATTLPNTMGQNDLQHEVTVENQVAQMSALLQATAQSGVVGAEISQPITLGSASAPPFANADSSTVLPGNASGGLGVSFTLAGPTSFNPPKGFGITQASLPAAYCSPTRPTTTVTCSTHSGVLYAWNFSAGNGIAYSVTLGTGSNLVELNFATNGSTITIAGISGMPTFIQILGSNDTLTLAAPDAGGNNPISVNITGNYDTIAAGSFPGGASTIYIHVIGDHDVLNGDSASGGNTFYVSVIGTADTLAIVPGSGSSYYTYFTGFDYLNPVSPSCPYGALAHNDSVTGFTIAKLTSANAHVYQTFNNSTSNPGNSVHNPSSRWSITNQTVAPFTCPFFSQAVQPISNGLSPPRASLVVQLRNTYAPSAEVAFDQGAVVYAQPGSIPIFYVPPPISFANGILTLFVPQFAGHLGSEAGVGTADITLRLLSSHSFVVPSNSFGFQNSSNVVITIKTPYAAAWAANLVGNSALAPFVTCAPISCVTIAKTLYYPGHALDTITLSIPTAGLIFDLLTAQYAINVD